MLPVFAMLRTLLLALIFLLSSPLAAQDAPGVLENIGVLVNDADRPAFDAFTPGGPGQFGLVGQEGERHLAALRQSGAGNLAVLYQLGAGQTATLEQLGAGNLLGLRLVGDDATVAVQQLGVGNHYLFDVAGSGFAHTVLQVGNGLRAVQTGATDVPFDIEQRGAGMSLSIQH
jgi:hypothetical protein